jgi:hypothetical protein
VTRLLMPIFGGITAGARSLRKPIILVADLAILVMTFRASFSCIAFVRNFAALSLASFRSSAATWALGFPPAGS